MNTRKMTGGSGLQTPAAWTEEVRVMLLGAAIRLE